MEDLYSLLADDAVLVEAYQSDTVSDLAK